MECSHQLRGGTVLVNHDCPHVQAGIFHNLSFCESVCAICRYRGLSSPYASCETLSKSLPPEGVHYKIDKYAGFGGHKRTRGVVDRDRPQVRIPVRHEANERTGFKMR
jgi:hypothetical protein